MYKLFLIHTLVLELILVLNILKYIKLYLLKAANRFYFLDIIFSLVFLFTTDYSDE